MNLLLLSTLMITSYFLTAQGVSVLQDGILPPRMSIVDRDTISAPTTGQLVYITDDNNFYYYNSTAWTQLSADSIGGWIVTGNNMSTSVSGNVGIGQPNPTQKLDVNGTVKGTNFTGNGATLTFGANTNMQPSLGISYIIALVGVYPSQSKGTDPYIGEIAMFAGNFAPQGWAFCNGQLLSIAQYSALFSLVGTYYGGDGETTFGLPDLRGRVPIHHGTGPGLTPRSIGQKVGVERVGQ